MADTGRLKRLLPALLSIAIIAVAGIVLFRTLGTIDLADVALRFRSIPAASLYLAALFTAGAYLAVALYEVVMLRYIQSGLPDRRPFLTGLVAFPIGHAVGFGVLSGGAVRYRSYSAAAVSTFGVGKVIVLSAMPYAMGLGLLCGISLVADAAEGARLLRVEASTAVAGGLALLAAHAVYVIMVLRARGPVRLRWFDLELPSRRMTVVQYLLGLVEVLLGIAVLYVLLPDTAAIGFLPFAAVYILAVVAGLLSSVPAGLGVFESMLLLMLRDVAPEALLGSVLAYRLVYELIPFVAAVMAFVGWEAWSRRHLLRRG